MLFARSFRLMTDRFHERLAGQDLEPLRPAHGFAFRYLAVQPSATAVDLAAHLGVSKQAATKTVAELVDWGYVHRSPHPTDRRAHALTLTGKGRAYLRLADALWAELEAEFAAVVGAGQLAVLRHALETYLADADPGGLRPVW
ncbi:MarR family winged helix-turn-helix transcriptional regulator [Saccharothrix texasensis]|uniref:MarR family transcriptional regulator n=1 Tax=Saccharothrix texasensis TaxID=103734 RepID=A0A3N1H8R4_9PSEU|nr:MarR family winged helix-turn-helix transcriptional regulator [Saccharothrix texasensis]ROP38924.1 MarR family transcriptional regulator [Saccharothrix texasensis]